MCIRDRELTYQLVIERSRGSRLWDIDGNEYVDVLNGCLLYTSRCV